MLLTVMTFTVMAFARPTLLCSLTVWFNGSLVMVIKVHLANLCSNYIICSVYKTHSTLTRGLSVSGAPPSRFGLLFTSVFSNLSCV